jgi:hypothetical protein
VFDFNGSDRRGTSVTDGAVERTGGTTQQPATTLAASGDGFVRGGTQAAVVFNGTDLQMKLNPSSDTLTRETYIKFNLAPVASVGTAKLRLYGNFASATSSNINVSAYGTSPSWNETTLTWNTKPAASTGALATTQVIDTTPRWYDWDVSSYVAAQKAAGATEVSFVLKSDAASDEYMTFASDEAAANKPQLAITQQSTALATTADSFVRGGSLAGSNFGTSTGLQVKLNTSDDTLTRETYLQYDLSTVGAVNSAKIRLYGNFASTASSNVNVSAYGTSASWTESGLTWNTKPAATTGKLATTLVVDTTPRWYEWDVTGYVQSEKAAGRAQVSFVLKSDVGHQEYMTFNSKEAATNRPELAIG